MFICNECGFVFDEPKEFYETHGLSTPPYEKWLLCPNCDETDFSEAIECSRCGELMSEKFAKSDDSLQPLCDVCYEDLNYE